MKLKVFIIFWSVVSAWSYRSFTMETNPFERSSEFRGDAVTARRDADRGENEESSHVIRHDTTVAIDNNNEGMRLGEGQKNSRALTRITNILTIIPTETFLRTSTMNSSSLHLNQPPLNEYHFELEGRINPEKNLILHDDGRKVCIISHTPSIQGIGIRAISGRESQKNRAVVEAFERVLDQRYGVRARTEVFSEQLKNKALAHGLKGKIAKEYVANIRGFFSANKQLILPFKWGRSLSSRAGISSYRDFNMYNLAEEFLSGLPTSLEASVTATLLRGNNQIVLPHAEASLVSSDEHAIAADAMPLSSSHSENVKEEIARVFNPIFIRETLVDFSDVFGPEPEFLTREERVLFFVKRYDKSRSATETLLAKAQNPSLPLLERFVFSSLAADGAFITAELAQTTLHVIIDAEVASFPLSTIEGDYEARLAIVANEAAETLNSIPNFVKENSDRLNTIDMCDTSDPIRGPQLNGSGITEAIEKINQITTESNNCTVKSINSLIDFIDESRVNRNALSLSNIITSTWRNAES